MSDATHAEPEFKAPEPGDQHQLMKPFEGKFRAEVKLWMGPGDPMVSTGTMVNEFHVDGLFLNQDYVGDPNEGPFPSFVGKGYWGYNSTKKQFEGFWIDNASDQMQTESGQVDESGKCWTMTSQFMCPTTQQAMNKRSVITLIDNDHHRMETFHTVDGNESKTMEINYQRA